MDAESKEPLPAVSIRYLSSRYGTSSDRQGKFVLSAKGMYTRVIFTYEGYDSVTRTIVANQKNELQIHLHISQTNLKDVSILSNRRIRYRNKGNPAVELIQQVIEHKMQNGMEHADYVQYKRINLSFFDLHSKLLSNSLFNKYRFMLDTTQIINGQLKTTFPVYISEKFPRIITGRPQ